jgi:hypothetical protein
MDEEFLSFSFDRPVQEGTRHPQGIPPHKSELVDLMIEGPLHIAGDHQQQQLSLSRRRCWFLGASAVSLIWPVSRQWHRCEIARSLDDKDAKTHSPTKRFRFVRVFFFWKDTNTPPHTNPSNSEKLPTTNKQTNEKEQRLQQTERMNANDW